MPNLLTFVANSSGRSEMNVAKSFAIAATFATVAVGAASPASADPAMSGHYTVTYTDPDGKTHTEDYYFTPCGDGCASAANAPNAEPFANAYLDNGRWKLVNPSVGWTCDDGSEVQDAATEVDTWDAITLVGKAHMTDKFANCGDPEPESIDYNTTFKKSP
jgi:hypothetical protein